MSIVWFLEVLRDRRMCDFCRPLGCVPRLFSAFSGSLIAAFRVSAFNRRPGERRLLYAKIRPVFRPPGKSETCRKHWGRPPGAHESCSTDRMDRSCRWFIDDAELLSSRNARGRCDNVYSALRANDSVSKKIDCPVYGEGSEKRKHYRFESTSALVKPLFSSKTGRPEQGKWGSRARRSSWRPLIRRRPWP